MGGARGLGKIGRDEISVMLILGPISRKKDTELRNLRAAPQ